jgi:hypothetical protein
VTVCLWQYVKMWVNCIDIYELNVMERKTSRSLWTWRSRAYRCWLEFRRLWVQVSAQKNVLIPLLFHLFLHSLHSEARTVLHTSHKHHLPHPLQFLISQSSCHCMACMLRRWVA